MGNTGWIKENGDVSGRKVSVKAAVLFCGFPEPTGIQGGECVSMEVVGGDPLRDDVIAVWAKGHAWRRKFLLRKSSGEYVVVRKGDDALAQQVVDSPPPPGIALEDFIEERRRAGRKAVDRRAMAERRGLRVWASNFFGGYWSPDYGEFDGLPEGWCLLPRGDAALTRRVRKGAHWILSKKTGRYSVELGTLAPEEDIERAFDELGGAEAALARREAKEGAQRKREEGMTEKLRVSMNCLFPKMPAEEVGAVLEISRADGAVGSAQWLYFPSPEDAREAYDHAANLAVRAYIRHRYTDYEEMLLDSFGDGEARADARRAVAPAIEKKLDEWREP